MRRLLDRFYAALTALAAVALVAAFASVMLGIVDRQVGWGLRGLDAYAGYAIAAALFLALPGTLQRGEHIRVTLVLNRLGKRAQAVLHAACLVAGVALAAMLAWYSARLVWVSHLTHDVSPGADATPLWLPQLAMALGCAGLLVALLDAAWSRATGGAFERSSPAGEAARTE